MSMCRVNEFISVVSINIAILFSKVVVLIYTPANCEWEDPFLHMLANTRYYETFLFFAIMV